MIGALHTGGGELRANYPENKEQCLHFSYLKTRADFCNTRKISRQLAKAVVVFSLESSTLTLLKIASLPSRSETLHTDQEKRVNKRVL